MKKLGVFSITLLAIVMLARHAGATCWVTQSGNAVPHNHTLHGINDAINNLGQFVQCDASGSTGYDEAIKFRTQDYCTDNPSWCPGVANDSETGLATIPLSEPMVFAQKELKVLIGNENFYDPYGYVVLDATSYTSVNAQGNVVTNVFSCPNGGADNYGLRNLIILTNGVTKQQVLGLSCVRQEYDVHVCGGTMDASKTPGANGWCVAAPTPNNDVDGDTFVDQNKGGSDCDDTNPNINPDAFEIPGDGIDQDCDGNDGGCNLTVTPGSGSVQAGQAQNYHVTIQYLGGYSQSSTVSVTGLHASMGHTPLNLDTMNSSGTVTVQTAAATPVTSYPLKVKATSLYMKPQTTASNHIVLPGLIPNPNLIAMMGSYSCEFNVGLTVTQSINPVDNDGDGEMSDTDCNDNDPNIHHGATEVCDGVDQNCDGNADNDLKTTYYRDFDNDGYGRAPESVTACTKPNGFVGQGGDCDDTNPDRNPGRAEICEDGIDQDCSGADKPCTGDGETDDDGDGSCEDTNNDNACDDGSDPGDCDDTNAAIGPSANEDCNDQVDNDCDGAIDANDGECGGPVEPCADGGSPIHWFQDADSDGYGSPSVSIISCVKPVGYIHQPGDCLDFDDTINPKGIEVCDGLDNNCDGVTDFLDQDNDSFRSVCPNDCQDFDPLVNPTAGEICGDGIDQNCDGKDLACGGTVICPDGTEPIVYYVDADGDGFGNPAISTLACLQPSGYVDNSGDCNDLNNQVNPNRPVEICGDGLDNNCDGFFDVDCQVVFDPFGVDLEGGSGCSLANPAKSGRTVQVFMLGLLTLLIWRAWRLKHIC